MDKPRFRAYICCGPNCTPKGSSDLVSFLEQELIRHGLDNEVSVAATGCQAHCESGPTMVVYPGPIYYQEIDRQRLERITKEHLAGGRPVEEYFWRGVRRRILPGGAIVTPKYVRLPEDATTEAYARPPRPKKPPPEVDDFKW